jgi:hypothetical protein
MLLLFDVVGSWATHPEWIKACVRAIEVIAGLTIVGSVHNVILLFSLNGLIHTKYTFNKMLLVV